MSVLVRVDSTTPPRTTTELGVCHLFGYGIRHGTDGGPDTNLAHQYNEINPYPLPAIQIRSGRRDVGE